MEKMRDGKEENRNRRKKIEKYERVKIGDANTESTLSNKKYYNLNAVL